MGFTAIIKVQFYFFWNSSNLATVSENFFVLFSPPDCFFALFELTQYYERILRGYQEK